MAEWAASPLTQSRRRLRGGQEAILRALADAARAHDGTVAQLS
eukprot:CAMPEP_0119058612 /NCGR_PEP_ID=MMETSP1178-20130426/2888_1 /TAXON_ID=33656 /ORGANISM="unid sp, Strain CCMP2000" /LENGTH=42 /DNA_ID= /DNA_START= /DNA_END= /DNA_ORIENTATION=